MDCRPWRPSHGSACHPWPPSHGSACHPWHHPSHAPFHPWPSHCHCHPWRPSHAPAILDYLIVRAILGVHVMVLLVTIEAQNWLLCWVMALTATCAISYLRLNVLLLLMRIFRLTNNRRLSWSSCFTPIPWKRGNLIQTVLIIRNLNLTEIQEGAHQLSPLVHLGLIHHHGH